MHSGQKTAIDTLWVDYWDRIRGYAWKAVQSQCAKYGRHPDFDEIEQMASNAIAETYCKATEREHAKKILWYSRKPEHRLTALFRLLSKAVKAETARAGWEWKREQKLLGKARDFARSKRLIDSYA